LIDQYGDQRFPMQLRMFAEAALGRGPGGADGTEMRKMYVELEGGQGDNASATIIDTTTGNLSRHNRD
jgi:mitochondrial splicing suppressor protein 51